MEVIDLFCGIGGFSHGATLAGANVILGVEADEKIADLYRKNFDHDVCIETLGDELLDKYVALVESHPAAHVHGSPPCQKLSQANKTGRDVQKGLELVRFYLDLVEKAQPKTWSMEQVNDPCLKEYLHRRGIDFVVVNTKDFDVPQSRRRVVCGSDCILERLRGRAGSGPTVVPSDVLLDLVPSKRYMLVNGTDNVPVRARENGRLVTVGHRPKKQDEGARSLDLPAHTVWRKPGKVYDSQVEKIIRVLTPRESASLQGFPAFFVLDDTSKTRSRQVVGNAVPPPLAKHIVEAATRHRSR